MEMFYEIDIANGMHLFIAQWDFTHIDEGKGKGIRGRVQGRLGLSVISLPSLLLLG